MRSRKSWTSTGALQHLLDEVVDDVPVVTGEAGDEPGHVLAAGHRQGGELQRGDPPLGPALQGVHVGRPELESHDLVQVRRRLLGREAQVGGPDLDEVAAGTKPRQRQGRVAPRGQHQVQPSGEVGQEEGHPLVDGRCVDDVVVVEQQDDVDVDRRQLVDQRGQRHLHGWWLRVLQQRESRPPDARHRRAQRGHHVAPEP